MSEENKPVIVRDNIKNIENGIESFKQQILDLKKSIETTQNEILRLEGCLIVFKGFENAGISKIVPDNYRQPNEEPKTPTFLGCQKIEPQLPPRPAFLDEQSNKLFQHIPHTH